MRGIVCLQGGRELTDGCAEMDRAVLDRCDGPVVVLAGAARVGDDYAGASDRARAYYSALGASVDIAPDPRQDKQGALEALQEVGLLVLPGGSPTSLNQVLSGAIRDQVLAAHEAGAAISGASAGAMVLCQRLALPSQGRREVSGLGLAPGVALVHWGGPTRERPPADGMIRWGLPEQGGVLLEDGAVIAVGQGAPSWLRSGRWRELPRDAGEPI